MAVLALARARDSTPCELSLVIDGTEHRVAIDASATPALVAVDVMSRLPVGLRGLGCTDDACARDLIASAVAERRAACWRRAAAADVLPCKFEFVVDGAHTVTLFSWVPQLWCTIESHLAHCGTATHCNHSQARVRQVRIAASYGSEF